VGWTIWGEVWGGGYAGNNVCYASSHKKFLLKRRVLAHFDRAGVEIVLMQKPTILVCSYYYKPILLPKMVNIYCYPYPPQRPFKLSGSSSISGTPCGKSGVDVSTLWRCPCPLIPEEELIVGKVLFLLPNQQCQSTEGDIKQ